MARLEGPPLGDEELEVLARRRPTAPHPRLLRSRVSRSLKSLPPSCRAFCLLPTVVEPKVPEFVVVPKCRRGCKEEEQQDEEGGEEEEDNDNGNKIGLPVSIRARHARWKARATSASVAMDRRGFGVVNFKNDIHSMCCGCRDFLVSIRLQLDEFGRVCSLSPAETSKFASLRSAFWFAYSVLCPCVANRAPRPLQRRPKF